MSLADRITRLEAILRPAAGLPVVLEECEAFADLPGLRSILRVRDGARWEQAHAESLDEFRARSRAEAAQGLRGNAGDTTIRLVMLRPCMSREQWLTRYGLGTVAA
jgi:hypothetical protein